LVRAAAGVAELLHAYWLERFYSRCANRLALSPPQPVVRVHMGVMPAWEGARMYHERYDPLLHPDELAGQSSTVSGVLMVSAVVSGGLLLYAVVTLIG
jgi:hypothetical protein